MNQAFRTRTALVFSMIVLAGCSRSKDAPALEVSAVAANAAPAATMAPGGEAAPAVGVPVASKRSLIVTMDLAVTVDDIDLAVGKTRAAVERSGGYVGDAKASGEGRSRHAHLVLRVPGDQARDVRGMMSALGKVTSDSESAVDVTEQHADLEARLGNARVQEKRILEIMKSSSGTIAEVLAAENELAKVRGSIESMEAQKRTLDHQIDLATLQLDLALPTAPVTPEKDAADTPIASIVQSAKGGAHGAYVTLVYLLMALAASLPFLVPLGLFVYGLVRFVRARRRAPLLQG